MGVVFCSGIVVPEYLFEYVQNGRWLKVSVIDPVTNSEASIVADARMDRAFLRFLAIRKLKKLQGAQSPTENPTD